MSSCCKNPECVRGLTPGVVVVGKGNAKTLVLGQSMRWAWVRCLACNPDPDDSKHGTHYKHVMRSPEERARRAELATAKAPYKQESAVNKALGALRPNGIGTSPQPSTAPAQAIANNEQLTKLLEQISQLNQTVMKLSNQVSDLLEENRSLRKQLEARAIPPSVAGESKPS